jgi:hypothetical protein
MLDSYMVRHYDVAGSAGHRCRCVLLDSRSMPVAPELIRWEATCHVGSTLSL